MLDNGGRPRGLAASGPQDGDKVPTGVAGVAEPARVVLPARVAVGVGLVVGMAVAVGVP